MVLPVAWAILISDDTRAALVKLQVVEVIYIVRRIIQRRWTVFVKYLDVDVNAALCTYTPKTYKEKWQLGNSIAQDAALITSTPAARFRAHRFHSWLPLHFTHHL